MKLLLLSIIKGCSCIFKAKMDNRQILSQRSRINKTLICDLKAKFDHWGVLYLLSIFWITFQMLNLIRHVAVLLNMLFCELTFTEWIRCPKKKETTGAVSNVPPGGECWKAVCCTVRSHTVCDVHYRGVVLCLQYCCSKWKRQRRPQQLCSCSRFTGLF